MKKPSRILKISSFLLALLIAVSTMISPDSLVSADVGVNVGELNIHKLSSTGVEAADQEQGKTYHPVTTGGVTKYHEYLAGAEYTIYKIGTMEQTVSNGVLQVKYAPVNGLVTKGNTPVTVLDDSTDPSQLAPTPAMMVSGFTNPVVTTATGKSTVPLPKDSVYLIKETKSPAGVNGSTDFIITVPMYIDDEWTYVIDAYPKNTYSEASIEKQIVVLNEAGDPITVDELHVNVGDTINYQVNVTVPVDIEAVDYTKFAIRDTPSSSLQIDADTVELITDNTGYTLEPNDDYTVEYSNNVLTVTLTADGIAKLKNGDILTLTYSAKVLPGAVNIEQGPVTNNVALLLEVEEEEVPPIEPPIVPNVKVYAYGIQKLGTSDADADIPLPGAKFVVATSNGNGSYTYLAFDDEDDAAWTAADSKEEATIFETETTGTGINSEAILQFMNLDPELTYYLVEIEAPATYTILPNPVAIQATKTTTDVVYKSYKKEANGGFTYQPGILNTIGFSMQIKNLKSDDVTGFLPATGGTGIYIFLLIGIALIAGAAALFVVSRRKNS